MASVEDWRKSLTFSDRLSAISKMQVSAHHTAYLVIAPTNELQHRCIQDGQSRCGRSRCIKTRQG